MTKPVMHRGLPPAIPELSDLDLSWQERSACTDDDLKLFYTRPGESGTRVDLKEQRERAAKAICRRCSVTAECLQWAMSIRDGYAILGGTTPEERASMRRKASRKRVAS